MKPIHHRRHDCRLCRSDQLKLVLNLEPTPIGDAYIPGECVGQIQKVYPLDLFLCENCGLVQLRDVIAPEILYENFIYETSISLGLTDHFQKYAKEVLDRIKPEQNSLVIDIGSNDGALLRFFKQHGMRVLGVEPANKIAKKAIASGIDTINDFFTAKLAEKIKKKFGPAAIVTSNNTFANIDDLSDMLEGTCSLLAPEGVFVVETGYLLDLVENGIFDNIYHEHVSYFAVKPLKVVFQRYGLELIDAMHIKTKDGSLRVLAHKAGGGFCASDLVQKKICREESAGIYNRQTYQTLASCIAQNRWQLNERLKALDAQGKKVAGYGASAATTTFVYQFDLGDRLEFIVDDNPAKRELFSPGLHIPVMSSSALYTRNPDYVVILAWRRSEAIIAKHQDYIARGGRFIVPWPQIMEY
ncbi:MAG: class I SAM-dependent methyltransferase [Desulfobacteraceae bacterium]|nr:class I SAM-dependent methyltransferase [Desulfobacteraceae bacterium]